MSRIETWALRGLGAVLVGTILCYSFFWMLVHCITGDMR